MDLSVPVLEINSFRISKCLSSCTVLSIYLAASCMPDILPYCFRSGSLTFLFLGIPSSSSALFWGGLSWWPIPKWYLEDGIFLSYIFSRCQKREGKNNFVLQAFVHGTSWLCVWIASYFLCKWRLTLKSVSLMLTGSDALWSPFQNLTPAYVQQNGGIGNISHHLLETRNCALPWYALSQRRLGKCFEWNVGEHSSPPGNSCIAHGRSVQKKEG